MWLTDGTRQMLFAGASFARQPAVPLDRQRTLHPGRPVRIGDFTVTAHLVDHSIYGAAAILIEANGLRLLYSGDLRFHGRKFGMARQLVAAVRRGGLDALLLEGTRLGTRASEENLTEEVLEQRILKQVRQAPGCVLAMYSPLNVDRFVTFFRVARRSGRIMVIDPYQAYVLHLLNRPTLPVPGKAADLQIMVPPRFNENAAGQAVAGSSFAEQLRGCQITAAAVRANPQRFLVLYRESMRWWLFPRALPSQTLAFFSYWEGYLREPRLLSWAQQLKAAHGQLLPMHASGHAHPEGLREFARAVRPRLLIPVHTAHAKSWREWFQNTRVVRNGEEIRLL